MWANVHIWNFEYICTLMFVYLHYYVTEYYDAAMVYLNVNVYRAIYSAFRYICIYICLYLVCNVCVYIYIYIYISLCFEYKHMYLDMCAFA